MTKTGWGSDGPEDAAPALPVTEMLLANRERGPGDTLAIAAARSQAQDARDARDAVANAPDPDARAATLVNQGYSPGLFTELSRRLADCEAELAGEEGKLEKARVLQERIRRDHAAGRITAFDIARMQAGTDDGDAGKVTRLQRRRESLREQIKDAAGMLAPPQAHQGDGVEAAATRAQRAGHEAFLEATRARLAGTPARRRERPFDGGGGDAEAPDCPRCQPLMRAGTRPATAAEAAEIHRTVCEGSDAIQHYRIDGYQAPNHGHGYNTTEAPRTGWEAIRAEDAADGVIRRGVEGGIRIR